MATSTLLGRLFIAARRQPWVSTLRRWIPESWRSYAWKVASQEEVIVVVGSRMRIPAADRHAEYLRDEYEPEVIAKVRELLRPGMTFCDVGANFGVLTLLGARLVGPTGRVFAFEPMPENARIVRQNIALNGLENVTLIEAGISETDGEALLHLSRFGGCHSMAGTPAGSLDATVKVRTLRLESIPGLEHIDVLKTDTEGTELAVLRSLGKRRPAHVILEASTHLFKLLGQPLPEHTGRGFLEALSAAGYAVAENLTEPSAGTKPLEQNVEGSWILYARPTEEGSGS